MRVNHIQSVRFLKSRVEDLLLRGYEPFQIEWVLMVEASSLLEASDGAAAEQWIKQGKNAITWTRLSCRRFAANAVRLQLHALAYNLANFLRTLALPAEVAQCS